MEYGYEGMISYTTFVDNSYIVMGTPYCDSKNIKVTRIKG